MRCSHPAPALLLGLLLCGLAHAAPVKLIYDTDMGNDIDDAVALAMIHSLEKRGACELLAVTITKDHPKAAAFVDAVNTFYGRPDVPIGVVKDGAKQEDNGGKFNLLADEKNADGSLRYPHDLRDGGQAPEAVGLIRKTLAAQPDQSVAIAQVGFFTNLSRLLDSKGDAHSPLTGRELIQKKVKLLSIMAGAFQTVKFDTRYLEYNVRLDIPAAQKLAREWPSPIVWSGFEIGFACTYPHESIQQDFDYVPHHPVKEAYILYNPPPHDRPNWDPTAVLYAVYPDRGYFELSPHGTVTVDDDAATVFRPGKNGQGRDRFLIFTEAQIARAREAITQLTTEPPAIPLSTRP